MDWCVSDMGVVAATSHLRQLRLFGLRSSYIIFIFEKMSYPQCFVLGSQKISSRMAQFVTFEYYFRIFRTDSALNGPRATGKTRVKGQGLTRFFKKCPIILNNFLGSREKSRSSRMAQFPIRHFTFEYYFIRIFPH